MAHLRMRLLLLLVLVACPPLFTSPAGALAPGDGEALRPRTQTLPASAFSTGRQGVVNAPEGLKLSGPQGSAETGAMPAPAEFNYLMLRWRADANDEHQVMLQVRVSEDGRAWTEWGDVHADPDAIDPDAPADVHSSTVIYAGISRYYQVRAVLEAEAGESAPVLQDVEVHTVDTRLAAPSAAAPSLAAPSSHNGRPGFVSRVSWGGSEVLNKSKAPIWYTANHLVLHHSADANSLRSGESSWADRVRAIWSYHTYTHGWGDVGYNWLVDPNGVIYEGRNGSGDATRDSVGMHDTANFGSMGVLMIGTFGPGVTGVAPVYPTAAAQNSVVDLFSWKAEQRGIDPDGRSYYYGCTVSVNYCKRYYPDGIVKNIAGHREVTPNHTSCPGDKGIEILPSIRARVRDRIKPPPAPAAVVQAELVSAEYVGAPVEAGGVVEVRFTVRNTGTEPIGTQEPQPGELGDLSSGHVYDENECFLGNGSPDVPDFQKETGRLRVVLGGTEGGTALGADCAGNSGGNPWRWGIGGTLQPGETRTVVGYVRFRNSGDGNRSISLQPGLVHENVRYFPSSAGTYNLTVTPERRAPDTGATEPTGGALASVYQLQRAPASHLARATDASSVKEGAYVGSFAWDGSAQLWEEGGPAGQSDQFVVVQTRPFYAPASGQYTFELSSDDGGWLWVDGAQIVSNYGLHGVESVSGTRWLPEGLHVLTVKYFEYVGGAYARYSWLPPGASDFAAIPVPRSAGAAERRGALGPGQQVALVADDLGGRGVSELRYAVDGGPEQVIAGNVGMLSLPDGRHSVTYRAMDRLGAWSASKSVTLNVDTVAPVTSLSAAVQANGLIRLTWTSSADATLFEIQSYDTATGVWTAAARTGDRSFAFLGIPGHSYQFRIRGSDDLNWEAWGAPSAAKAVPATATFSRAFLPFTTK